MKLPFVSRGVYEDALRQRDRALLQVEKLTQTVVAMKVAGGTVRPIVVESNGNGHARPRRELSEIEKAVDGNPRCRRDPRLAGKMIDWAEQMIAGGANMDHVLERIQTWNQVPKNEPADDEEVF